MPNLLLSGPAGAGKTQEARRLIEESAAPTIALDFQTLYAALLLIERQPDGRYPERLAHQSYVIPMVEYLRRAGMTGAEAQQLNVILTNSDGSAVRRDLLLRDLGGGAVERVIDPGIDTVTERLSFNGTLSDQCGEAIHRWYGRK